MGIIAKLKRLASNECTKLVQIISCCQW